MPDPVPHQSWEQPPLPVVTPEIPRSPATVPEVAVFEKEVESETRETVPSLAEAVARIKERFLGRLEARFSASGEIPLDYHGPLHSLMVAETTKKFLQTIRAIDPALVSEEDVLIGELEGLAHDLVQEAEIVPGKNRKRQVGGNEEKSAEELLTELERYVLPNGEAAFPVADPTFRQKIRDDIATTIPGFEVATLPDGTQGFRVAQRDLSAASSLRALALASADLRNEFLTGKDPQSFFAGGNAEFREVRLPIQADLAHGIENISPERRAQITEEILSWKRAQVGFAKWQKILFQESIENNAALAGSPEAQALKTSLLTMFGNFDTVIEATAQLATRLEEEYGGLTKADAHTGRLEAGDQAFAALLKEMGYPL